MFVFVFFCLCVLCVFVFGKSVLVCVSWFGAERRMFGRGGEEGARGRWGVGGGCPRRGR